MKRVLVLRPEPGASATVGRALERGLDAVAVPLFEIEAVAWEAVEPGAYDGLLLTSANAVRQAGPGLRALRALKVHAVGEASAEAARDAGLEVTTIGDKGVEELLGSLDPRLRLLHLCGEDRVAVSARQRIDHRIVYRSKPIGNPDLSAAGGSVALIHSPRAGRRLAELVGDRGSVAIAAISDSAAEAAGTGWLAIEAAAQPTDDALLALASRLCNKPDPE